MEGAAVMTDEELWTLFAAMSIAPVSADAPDDTGAGEISKAVAEMADAMVERHHEKFKKNGAKNG
jgi:hypothetical protein